MPDIKLCRTCGHANPPEELCCLNVACGADISAAPVVTRNPGAGLEKVANVPDTSARPARMCPQCHAANADDSTSCRTCFADLSAAEPSAPETNHRGTIATQLQLVLEGQAPLTIQPGDVVGRGARGESALAPFSGVSREHARFLVTDGQWFVEDLGSTNGITVNDRAVPAHLPHSLADGDRLGMSRAVTFSVRLVVKPT